MDGAMGPCFWHNSNPGRVTYTGQTTVIDSTFTFAGIFKGVGATIDGPLFTTSSGVSGIAFYFNSNTLNVTNFSNNLTMVSGLSPQIPYFIALSVTSQTTGYCVVVNLLTGKTTTTTASGSYGTLSAPNGTYYINFDVFADPFNAYIAAIMYSAGSISQSALQQWATDPWSYWYPRKKYSIVGMAAAAAGALFRPSWGG
jgi:hypothetical protein